MESVVANTGELTRRIELHRSTDTVAADGQPVEETSGVATLVAKRWARIRAKSGVEKHSEQQTVTDVTWEVVMRSDSVTRAIDLGYYLKTPDGKRLDVTWLGDPSDGREWIVLECVENRAV
jgi:head-tail adaptor